MSRWRRRILVVIAIGYIVWWAGLLAATTGVADALVAGGAFYANAVMIVGLVAWAVPLTILLTAGRRLALRLRTPVRDALEDELTQANRSVAFQTGYWALLAAVCALYAVAQFSSFSAKAALPVLIAIGVSAPLLRFAMLERRGDSDG